MCHGQKSRFIGDGHPTFNRNPYNVYITPYYILLLGWFSHPLLYGNHGSWSTRSHISWNKTGKVKQRSGTRCVLDQNRLNALKNDDNHAFFHFFLCLGTGGKVKMWSFVMEPLFFPMFPTFSHVPVGIFWSIAVSSCVNLDGIIVQTKELCRIVANRMDSSCFVCCHALHYWQQTRQASSTMLLHLTPSQPRVA